MNNPDWLFPTVQRPENIIQNNESAANSMGKGLSAHNAVPSSHVEATATSTPVVQKSTLPAV